MVDCRRFVLISGCSGGGKSTLLAELQSRGYQVVPEPGRRIVVHELQSGGHALPWIDPLAFLNKAVEMSLDDIEAARGLDGWVFFDRGLFDAASALQELMGEPVLERYARLYRFHNAVFMAPPWPEIYASDQERPNPFENALPEFERLTKAYPRLGYEVTLLPKVTVSERAEFVIEKLFPKKIRIPLK